MSAPPYSRLAFATPALVLTDARAPALLALAPPALVLTDACAPTLALAPAAQVHPEDRTPTPCPAMHPPTRHSSWRLLMSSSVLMCSSMSMCSSMEHGGVFFVDIVWLSVGRHRHLGISNTTVNDELPKARTVFSTLSSTDSTSSAFPTTSSAFPTTSSAFPTTSS
jgi:hypothetical protein